METIIRKVDCAQMQTQAAKEALGEASQILKKGGLVAFPTETVYGLGGDALCKEAAGRIYSAKGRPSDNPLIVLIGDLVAVNVLAEEISQDA